MPRHGWYIISVYVITLILLTSSIVASLTSTNKYRLAESGLPTVSVDDFIKKSKSLDLIGLRYRPNWFGQKLIHMFTGSTWTHVACLWNGHVIEVNTTDHSVGRINSGLQITRLESWISKYIKDYDIIWVTFNHKDDKESCYTSLCKSFDQLVKNTASCRLVCNPFAYGGSIWKDRPFAAKWNLPRSRMLCTELLIYYYQQLGIIDKTRPTDSYDPAEMIFERLSKKWDVSRHLVV